MHKVICACCGVQFDKDTIPFVMFSTKRYAHKDCMSEEDLKRRKEEMDYNDLEKYIKAKFKIERMNAKIKKQIVDFKRDYNYTYSGMKKSLIWWFDIKGNTLEKTMGGIGIIPYIYQDAMTYYYTVYLATTVNQQMNVSAEIAQVSIKNPKAAPAYKRMFELE